MVSQGVPARSAKAAPQLTSVAGLLSHLEEDDDRLKHYALERLDILVNDFWAEIADNIEKIEKLFENEKFPHRKLAALLASKVHYHLEEFNQSLQYALGAEELFDVSAKTEYVETTIAKCIDKYIAERCDASKENIDARLEGIVERMFERCFTDRQWKQAIGIGLEARRLDKVEEAITHSADDRPALLEYSFHTCQTLVTQRSFRGEVLKLLLKLYKDLDRPDYLQICLCLMLLDDAKQCAEQLEHLVRTGDENDELTAYQIAFDLSTNEIQHFLLAVRNALTPPVTATKPVEKPKEGEEGGAEPPAEAAAAETEISPADKRYGECFQKLRGILLGENTIALHLDFLCRNNASEMRILKNIKNALEVRNSVTHQATVFANATMHSGTTVDSFVLGDNLEWVKRATNWAKFSAIACLGMIYKGCVKTSLQVMRSCLPGAGNDSHYTHGGAYYALGLIHANHGEGILSHLVTALQGTTNEVVQHGACLGLGLAGMATENEELYEKLYAVLQQDSAVAGEAAGIAMGLVMLGTQSETAVDQMLGYARLTQHEKIIRGLALGLALLVFGREESADTLIEHMTRHEDPILRYGGMYAIAMAYSGTANNSAIRRLLHVAVSDVSDDVRRAAVMALGFVLTNLPDQCPRVVSLLSESYNPHVRYGATLAVGISCAGTGLKDALELLEPMASDPVDFVRQGALIALAMVLVQSTEPREPKVNKVREMFTKVISDKHEDVMAKFGAIIASGIIDAGGRNVTIGLRSNSGQPRMSGVVGMAVFTQYWYWYPLMHFISLSFQPTCIIGLNKNLEMPAFTLTSHTKPSLFAYPPETKEAEEKKAEKVATAVLSTTAKAKAREKEKEREKLARTGSVPMETVDESTTPKEGDTVDKMEIDKEEKKKEEEPEFTTLHNPARVLTQQQKFITVPDGSRFRTLKRPECGILMLVDTRPGEEAEIIQLTAAKAGGASGGAAEEEEEGPAPPEPFEFTED